MGWRTNSYILSFFNPYILTTPPCDVVYGVAL